MEVTQSPTRKESSDDNEHSQDVGVGDIVMAVTAGESASESNLNLEQSAPPPGHRLMITKMELENFKSYAGIKTIGPFHKCFSSVVGPNGSGKSNVIDAMLFVFGKRAKKLRLNKVSELIHSSDAFKNDPLPYARVSVYFQEIVDTGDGDEDYDVIRDSEVVVTRVAKRDNSSSYKLDGKNCSFQQVAKYLESKGIDLDNNRFLILQGEVEMISMMPPKGKTENDEGLLEYLEDIIGSNKYVEDANDAAAKVEALTEQRQEKLNRVKAVEKEKDGLEGAKQEAEALLAKEREIRRKKNILFQIHTMKLAEEINNTKETKASSSTKLESERRKLEETKERLAEIANGIASQTAEYEKAHTELVNTKEEFAAYERRDIKLREDLKHEKANKKKLESKVKSESEKQAEAEKKIKKAEKSIPTLEEAIEEQTYIKQEEDSKLEQIFEGTKVETEKLRKQLEIKTQELSPVNQERALFQSSLDTATTEVKLLEDTTTRAKEQLAAAEEELASLDSRQKEKRIELQACEEEITKSKQRIIDIRTQDAVLANQEKGLAQQSNELTAKAEEAKAALHGGGGATRSRAVTGILRAARNGGELSKVGVLGRLGDLASISEEYDIAVSTACGMLDHIVVQTTAGAQRCLGFLRKHGLGRANFIPLDKMKKGAHDRAVETPEGAPRLFDLITPSNFAITPALYLGVGNTLVARDLETATRWAYEFGKRWRVVTLDGNLIELSGTMQGGGNSVRKGGMKLLNSSDVSMIDVHGEASQDECARLDDLAAKALEELQNCRSQRRTLADEARELNKSIRALSTKVPKLSMDIQSYDTSREELTKRIPELRGQCTVNKEDTAKLVELNKNVEKCRSDMASCVELASKLDAEVAQLQKAILDAGGSRLKKQQKKCEDILAKLNSTSKQLSSAKVAITTSQKAASKAETANETAKEELKNCISVLNEKKDEFKVLENEAFQVMQAYEKVKEIESEKKKALEAVSKECEDLKKEQSKIKYVEIELVAKIDNCDKTINDCERRRRKWKDELSKLVRAAKEEEDSYFSDDEEDDEHDNIGNESMDEDEVMESTNDRKTLYSQKRMKKKSHLPVYPANALAQYSREEVKQNIEILEKEYEGIAKNANMNAISEYKKKADDYLARVSELDEVTKGRDEARKAHEELRKLRHDQFMDGFGIITLKLKEMYQMITLGGDAELELVDSLDPFSEGIVFSVRPPKKSWKNISNLSGGEKTLSSLALVFALHHYKPTPLYVMDEIDAALDFKNVSIVANYIKERTKNAQFIIISLRNNMFELADRLVGIYKTFNCTKSITIDPKAFSCTGSRSGRVSALNDRTNSLTHNHTTRKLTNSLDHDNSKLEQM